MCVAGVWQECGRGVAAGATVGLWACTTEACACVRWVGVVQMGQR